MSAYTEKQLADGMRRLFAQLEASGHPLSKKFLSWARGAVETATHATKKPGAPTRWSINSNRRLFIYIHRRLGHEVLYKCVTVGEVDRVPLQKWNSEARKTVFADFPWREFPFRSLPSYDTLKDRYNKACRDLKEAGEFHLLDNVILLETVYRIWGDKSEVVYANLPEPLDTLSPLAGDIFRVMNENNGNIIPPD